MNPIERLHLVRNLPRAVEAHRQLGFDMPLLPDAMMRRLRVGPTFADMYTNQLPPDPFVPYVRSILNLTLLLDGDPTHIEKLKNLLYSYYIVSPDTGSLSPDDRARYMGLTTDHSTRNDINPQYLVRAIKLMRDVYESGVDPNLSVNIMRGSFTAPVESAVHKQVTEALISKGLLTILIPALIYSLAQALDGNVASQICGSASGLASLPASWWLGQKIFGDTTEAVDKIRHTLLRTLEGDYKKMRPMIPSLFDLWERPLIKQLCEKDPNHNKEAQLICDDLGSRMIARLGISLSGNDLAYVNLAETQSPQTKELVNKVLEGGNSLIPPSQILYRVAFLELIRSKYNADELPFMTPSQFAEFISIAGKERLKGIKNFSAQDPAIALELLAPARLLNPEVAYGQAETNISPFIDAIYYGNKRENYGTTGLLPLVSLNYWRLYEETHTNSYFETGMRRLADNLNRTSPLSKAGSTRSTLAEINRHPLWQQAFTACAVAYHEGRQNSTGTLKHVVKAICSMIASCDSCPENTYYLLDKVSTLQYYINFAKTLNDLGYDQVLEGDKTGCISLIIRHFKTVQKEIITRLGQHFLKDDKKALSESADPDVYEQIMLLYYYTAVEVPRLLPELCTRLQTAFSRSGEEASRHTHPLGLIVGMHFLNSILQADNKSETQERNRYGVRVQNANVRRLHETIVSVSSAIVNDTINTNLHPLRQDHQLSENYLRQNLDVVLYGIKIMTDTQLVLLAQQICTVLSLVNNIQFAEFTLPQNTSHRHLLDYLLRAGTELFLELNDRHVQNDICGKLIQLIKQKMDELNKSTAQRASSTVVFRSEPPFSQTTG